MTLNKTDWKISTQVTDPKKWAKCFIVFILIARGKVTIVTWDWAWRVNSIPRFCI